MRRLPLLLSLFGMVGVGLVFGGRDVAGTVRVSQAPPSPGLPGSPGVGCPVVGHDCTAAELALSKTTPAVRRPPPSGARPLDRSAVLAVARANQNELRRVDRIDAKLTTWSQYMLASGLAQEVQIASDVIEPSSEVWVVAVAGQVAPARAQGETYPWGVLVYDRNRGTLLHRSAYEQGSWPPYFDGLPNN